MSQHLSRQILEGYLNRTLGRDNLLAADRHLAECGGCQETMSDLVDMDQLAIEISEVIAVDPSYDEHLDYEILEGYVDGSLSDVSLEIADVHTADCESCRGQLNDLRELKANIGRSPEIVLEPAGRTGIWDTISSAFVLKAALAAGLLLFLGLGLLFLPTWRPIDNLETAVVTDTSQTEGDTSGDPVVEPIDVDVTGTNSPTAANAKPSVTVIDGGKRIEIDQNENLSGIDAGRFEARLKAVLATGDVKVSPAARELRSPSGVLMSSGESGGAPFALTSPVGRVIAADRPQLSWRPLVDAETYVVTIFDENFTKVAESPELKVTFWTPVSSLKRGAIYNWQVTANKSGQEIKSPVRPAPDAKFKIIDAATANDLEAARRTGSHLLLGTVYANAGMTTEAEREFQLLLKQNPRSELARKLLRKIQANK